MYCLGILIQGNSKKKFYFFVDNGPSEQPFRPMVQMLLVRLLKFLGLKKVYKYHLHFKRNFVERVHASENIALSRHGPFSSTAILCQVLVSTRAIWKLWLVNLMAAHFQETICCVLEEFILMNLYLMMKYN